MRPMSGERSQALWAFVVSAADAASELTRQWAQLRCPGKCATISGQFRSLLCRAISSVNFDVTPFLGQDEGQHFERKALFTREGDAPRPRNRREVRDQIAEYVAAFANAEGGVLILGIEDYGTATVIAMRQMPSA
jgi:hypothetical protein